jgi:LysM repeat protein
MQLSFAVLSLALATLGAAVPMQSDQSSIASVLPRGEASIASRCPSIYTVQPGDSCFKIASSYFLTVSQLEAGNPGLNCNKGFIYPGQRFCVPLKSRCSKTHTVKSGEFCYSIAQKYGLSVAQLENKNAGLSCNKGFIYPGQVFCV